MKQLFSAALLLGLGTVTTMAHAAPAHKMAPKKTMGKTMAPKVITKPSGLKIQDLRVGKGKVAHAGESVTVNYRGTLTNGTEFDKSYGRGPFTFYLGAGSVIPGWDEGLVGMREGGKRKLIIPAKLGYGEQGSPPKIPGNATLVFVVELVKAG